MFEKIKEAKRILKSEDSAALPSPQPGKHTPGPWKQGFVNPLSIVDSDGQEIAEIPHGFTHHKGTILAEQYARILAAAPELLEALEIAYCHISRQYFRGKKWGLRETLDAIKPAIRKAKGETL